MADNGKAFVKGGVGCFIAFIVLAVIAVAFGGTAHIDLGGVVILFVIGGLIGLVVNAIYRKGKNDANGEL